MKHNCGLTCVELENVGVKSGGATLLSGVDLQLHCGKITAIIGPNGAGKTTLVRAILGERPHTGTIRFCDHNSNTVENIKIGYVPQKLDFDTSSPVCVEDVFCAAESAPSLFFRGRARRDGIKKQLEANGCGDLLRRRLGELSGGELQRIMLCLALHPVPDLLILDEPVSGVDATGLERFYETVSDLRNNYHMAIVLVSHDLAPVRRYADDAVLLSAGRPLVCGTAEEVFATDEFRRIFGNIGGERA